MTFALGQRARREVVKSLANLRNFEHGGISGRLGGCTRLNKLPREYRRGLADAYYVVYCYDTPIAWVVMEDDATEAGRVNYLPDWQYSATTTYHQSLVSEVWGDKIVDPDRSYSWQQNRGTARGRTSDERYSRDDRVPAEARSTRPPVRDRTAALSPHAQYSYENPDYVPGRNWKEDQAAEVRDWRKVKDEAARTSTRAHP